MISIVKRKKKCCLCGKTGEGLMFVNLRLDRLPPVFLCALCLENMRTIANERNGKKESGKENGEERETAEETVRAPSGKARAGRGAKRKENEK